MTLTKDCLHCGQPFAKKRCDDEARWALRKYCSKRCFGLHRQATTGHMAALSKIRDKWLEDSANRERMAQARRQCRALGRERAGAARTEQALGWCPQPYRGAYRNLVKTHRVKAAEARRMIMDLIAKDAARKERELHEARRAIEDITRGMRDRAAKQRAQAY